MVDILESGDRAHLSWLGRPELGVTFTKLHCWTLTQYSKCVFLDADTLVLCNIDELFDYEELSAAPDPGWPDCFNSGVFVFRPSLNTHTQLLEHATQHGSFDGGDQGVLNTFFSDWAVKDIQKHLPFVYNLTASALYTYLPAFHRFGHQAKIVHFLGGTKPWHYPLNAQEANESSLRDSNMNTEKLIHLWWSEYYSQRQTKVLKDDLKEDSSLDYHLEQQLAPSQTPQTPSQSKKSNTEAHHRVEKTPSQPLLDLNLDTLTISSSEKPVGMNILFDVLSGGDPEERSLVVPFFGQESKDTGPETSDDSIATTGEAEPDNIPTETEEENLEHRRMWEEGHIDYMGIDAFDNIERKLDRFLD
ncbi:glycogenin-2 isoform X4 [Myxocyprinus asiaticus]|nr:glycogenin-2 isoform X4 [Myxocyprinus asiaticus]